MQFASLFGGQEVFTWSDCQLELGTDRVVSDLVFVKILSYKGGIRSRKDRRQKSFLIAVFLFLASCTNAERLTFTRSGLFLKLKRISLELWLQIALWPSLRDLSIRLYAFPDCPLTGTFLRSDSAKNALCNSRYIYMLTLGKFHGTWHLTCMF